MYSSSYRQPIVLIVRVLLQFLLLQELMTVVLAVDLISSSTCSQQKSCFFRPQGCNPQRNCTYAFTYAFNRPQSGANDIDFEVQGNIGAITPPQGKYLALGFNKEKRMAGAAVTACVYLPRLSTVRVILTFNDGYSNRRIQNYSTLESQILSNVEGGLVNEYLVCRFRQKAASPTPISDVYTLDSQQYNLLFATGPADPDTMELKIHSLDRAGNSFPVITEKTDLQAKSAVAAVVESGVPSWSGQFLGILMIFGWWLFVPTAIFFARYFRPIWPNTQPCGLKLWFHFHRGIMLFAILSVMAGFICIVIKEEGKFVSERTGPIYAHAVCGLTAFIGILVQPIVALFRCKPDHPLRPLYNWPHRVIGIGSFGCSCAAIWLAQTAFGIFGQYADASRGLMIFYYVIVCVIALLLEIHVIVTEICRRPRKIDTSQVPMQTMNGNSFSTTVINSEIHYSRSWAVVRGALLLVFVLSAIGVTIALTAMLGLSMTGEGSALDSDGDSH